MSGVRVGWEVGLFGCDLQLLISQPSDVARAKFLAETYELSAYWTRQVQTMVQSRIREGGISRADVVTVLCRWSDTKTAGENVNSPADGKAAVFQRAAGESDVLSVTCPSPV